MKALLPTLLMLSALGSVGVLMTRGALLVRKLGWFSQGLILGVYWISAWISSGLEPYPSLPLLVGTLSTTLLFLLLLRGTKRGQALRAVAQSPLAAVLVGIRKKGTRLLAITLGAAIAALSGHLAERTLSSLGPWIVFIFLILAELAVRLRAYRDQLRIRPSTKGISEVGAPPSSAQAVSLQEPAQERRGPEPLRKSPPPVLLRVDSLSIEKRGHRLLTNLSFGIPASGLCCITGPLGSGKSLLLEAMAGLVPYTGSMQFSEERIPPLRPNLRVRRGLILIPEGRPLFSEMTVAENLELGAFRERSRKVKKQSRDRVLELFPKLAERMHQRAGALSLGEQAMLTIGRAIMSNPKLLLIDKPCAGVAARLRPKLWETIAQLPTSLKIPVVLAEDDAGLALSLSDHAVLLKAGALCFEGPASALRGTPLLSEVYHEGDSKRGAKSL